MLRWLIFTTLTVAMVLGSSRDTGWHTEHFASKARTTKVGMAPGVSAARRTPGKAELRPIERDRRLRYQL